MTDFRYLIVGGGMVADAAARGIRELDTDGSIGILSEDVDRPYARPALSKKLWTDPDFSWDDKVDLHTEETGAQFVLGTTVTAIDRAAKTVTTADGATHGYERLLLATGGKPRGLPGLSPSARVLDYRSASDYRRCVNSRTPEHTSPSSAAGTSVRRSRRASCRTVRASRWSTRTRSSADACSPRTWHGRSSSASSTTVWSSAPAAGCPRAPRRRTACG